MNNNNDDSRRDFLVDALGLGLFAGFTASGVLQPSYALSSLPDRLPEGQSIYKLSGDVRVNGNPADLKTRIDANALVQTGKDSEVIFVVSSEAFILRSDSELQLSGIGFVLKTMRLVSGAILGVFGKREAPRTATTTTATIGIRGTGIYIEAEPDRTYACTCYGHTRISANSDPNVVEDIVTTKHDKPVYILPSSSQQKLIVPAPIINHSDKELALVEALVGRETPWGGTGYKVYD